jgi:hypothetical protein
VIDSFINELIPTTFIDHPHQPLITIVCAKAFALFLGLASSLRLKGDSMMGWLGFINDG